MGKGDSWAEQGHMTLSHQPRRRKARRYRDIQRGKSALGVAARERNRMARMSDAGQWRQVGLFVCVLEAHADGRHFGVRIIGRDDRRQVGTWRTCAAAVGRLWREAAKRQEAR